MTSPMSDYSDPKLSDFLGDFKKKVINNDPRLEYHQDIIKDYGES